MLLFCDKSTKVVEFNAYLMEQGIENVAMKSQSEHRERGLISISKGSCERGMMVFPPPPLRCEGGSSCYDDDLDPFSWASRVVFFVRFAFQFHSCYWAIEIPLILLLFYATSPFK